MAPSAEYKWKENLVIKSEFDDDFMYAVWLVAVVNYDQLMKNLRKSYDMLR